MAEAKRINCVYLRVCQWPDVALNIDLADFMDYMKHQAEQTIKHRYFYDLHLGK